MDRLTLTLFGLHREQEAALKEISEACGWDYVHEISLPFLNFVETFLARNSFVMPFFATYDTTVVNVEPETERKGDSCASARNVTAGVDVSHSSQGNEATELDGDRQECVFCFVPRVKPVLGSSGCVKGRMLTREILGSGRNCIGNVGP